MEKGAQNWYVRRGDTHSGPFPAGLISRYILLGRIREDDEVSRDRTVWARISSVPGLVPRVLREARARPEDEQAQARLVAALRWADERWGAEAPPAGLGERRRSDPAESFSPRKARRKPGSGSEEGLRPAHYAGFGLVLALLVAVPFAFPSGNSPAGPACDAPAAPGIDWSGCLFSAAQLANTDLSGARLQGTDLSGATLRAAKLYEGTLSYANLSEANLRGADLRRAQLKGANLRRANLRRADLRGADLSYAVLQGARLEGANLRGARLDYAQWRDGIICMPGSVGRCRPARVNGS